MGPQPAVAAVRSAVRRALADLPPSGRVAGGLLRRRGLGGAGRRAGLRGRRHAPAGRAGHHRPWPAAGLGRPRPARVAELGYRARAGPGAADAGPGRQRRRPGGRSPDRPLCRAGPVLAADGADPARPHRRRPGRDGAARARARVRPPLDRRHARRSTGATCVRCSGCAGPTPRLPAPRSGCRYWQDPHNSDRRFQRARLRPRCCRCSRTSCRAGWPARWPGPPSQLQDDLDALDQLADRLLEAAVGRRLLARGAGRPTAGDRGPGAQAVGRGGRRRPAAAGARRGS